MEPYMNFSQPLSGASAGLGSLFGLVNGIGQLIKSNRIKADRPEYEIPDETKQMLALRQNLLNAGMPGEQQAQQDIYTNQANALAGAARGASDQSQYLGLLGAAQAATNNATNNLATQHAQNYMNNLDGLERAQQGMTAAKDKEWELNKYYPYLMQLQQKYQLKNAGNQNLVNGISGLSSLSSAFGGSGGGSQMPINSLSGQVGLQGISPIGSVIGQATLAPGGANLAAMTGNNGGLLGLLSNPAFLAAL